MDTTEVNQLSQIWLVKLNW